MNRIALIPAYEPGEILISLVRELHHNNFYTVVVDDGSGSGFSDIFEKAKLYAQVISYPENHGKGYALKTGLGYIRGNFKRCTIVTMDSDGQHTVTDAIRLCQEAEYYESSVTTEDNKSCLPLILGSRKLPEDAPFKSRFGNRITRSVYRTITGISVYDTQSGLRAFSSDWVPVLLEIPGSRYEYEMNVLLYIAKHKLPIKEIPIEVIYFDKKNSVSHFNALTDSFKIYKEILKFSASSAASFVIDYSVYALALRLGASLLAANYGARAISSVFNFTVNKMVVFKTRGKIAQEAVRYFALVLFNITLNSLILTGLTESGLNEYAGKLIVEMIMFLFSYAVQHSLIFKNGNDSP